MRLHLVDGTFELFRAHFSPGPDRRDPAGRDVKASLGVVRSLLALLGDEEERVTHCAVAFDNPIESFRNQMFPTYKDGSGVEDDLLAQFDLVEEGVRAVGLTVWSMDRYEADDALATAAVTFVEELDQVRILTPDKDLAQVVAGDRIVQVDRMRDREFDEEGVVERLGVVPASVPDYLALVGDTADGIPGLPGFGAKTAASLLRTFGHLEELPEDPARWEVRGAPRLAAVFAERRQDALLYRDLATLRTDVPLGCGLEDLAYRGPDAGVLEAWAAMVGSDSLAERARSEG